MKFMKNANAAKKKLISRSSFNLTKKSLSIPLKRFLYASFGIALFNIVLVIALQRFIPPEVPLFYGEAVGENQLTTNLGLIIPGIVAVVVTLINLTLSFLLENAFLQKVLILSAFAVSLLCLITSVKIILLVGSFNL